MSRPVFKGAILALALSCAAGSCLAQAKEKEAPPPGKVEGRIEVVPFEPAHMPTPEVEAWLDKLEAKSKATTSLHATVRYDMNQLDLMDEQKRYGKLVYTAGPPAKFAVHFETLKLGKAAVPSNRRYIFDGVWLVEKLEDKKQFFKWQVTPPASGGGEAAAPADALALGRGPFVVPVKLEKKLLLEKYKVELATPDEKEDPKDSVHLTLTPLKGRRIQFTKIDLWYDKTTLLPQRAQTMNASNTQTIIHLSDVKANEPVDEKMIDVAEPKEKGWEVQITPWEGK